MRAEIELTNEEIAFFRKKRKRTTLTYLTVLLGAMLVMFSVGWGVQSMIHEDDHAVEIAKSKVLDGHCRLERILVSSLRRDLWRGGFNNLRINFAYRDTAFHEFESARMCMEKENGDPVFFPQFCMVTETEADIPCILNQLDMLLVVMR